MGSGGHGAWSLSQAAFTSHAVTSLPWSPQSGMRNERAPTMLSEHSTVSRTHALSASHPLGTGSANTGATRTHGVGTGVNNVLCSQDTPEGQEQNTGLHLRKTCPVSGAHCICTRVTDETSQPTHQAGGIIPLLPLRGLRTLARDHAAHEWWSRVGGSVVQNIRGSFLVLSGKAGVTH